VRIPSVPGAEREGRQRVEFTRSPSNPVRTGSCAKETAGVDVKHPLRIAALDASIGRRTDLQGSRREQPESARDRAFGFTRYRLISGGAGGAFMHRSSGPRRVP
jgi:hypothetical protein